MVLVQHANIDKKICVRYQSDTLAHNTTPWQKKIKTTKNTNNSNLKTDPIKSLG